MIFTAGPLARSQVTSQMFKDMGALNLAPTVVGEVRVTGIRCRITNETMFVLSSLWAIVASILLSKKVPTDKTVLATITPINLDLFPRPAMITVVKNMTDNLQTKLLALGFSMQSQGTYKFYKGAGTDQAIRDLTELGAEVDSHAPRNTTSMHGIMALGVINRVLHAAYSVFAQTIDTKCTTSDDLLEITDYAITHANLADSLPTYGQFLPYFEGLLLADDGFTMNTFLGMFSSLLGNNPTEVAENSATLVSGWSTLANTPSGRAISHAIFCLDIAVKFGYDMRPVFLHNEYSGTVLCGKNAWLIHGRKLVKATEEYVLKEEISSMISHDSALEDICNFLSTKEVESTKQVSPFTPAAVTTARALHYRIIDRKLTPEDNSKLRAFLRKTRFNQKFWDVTDASKVHALVVTLTAKERLPISAPIYIGSDAFFSSDLIYSSVAAFGASAPSIIGFGTTLTKPWTKDVYTGVTKPGNLAGIPIFKKSLQQAFEDWKKFLNDGHVVSWSHAGRDRMGRMKVKNGAGFILFGSTEEKGIMARLNEHANQKGRNKRTGADLDAEAQKKKDDYDEEKHKRRRIKGMGMLGLMNPPTLGAGSSYQTNAMDDSEFD